MAEFDGAASDESGKSRAAATYASASRKAVVGAGVTGRTVAAPCACRLVSTYRTFRCSQFASVYRFGPSFQTGSP